MHGAGDRDNGLPLTGEDEVGAHVRVQALACPRRKALFAMKAENLLR